MYVAPDGQEVSMPHFARSEVYECLFSSHSEGISLFDTAPSQATVGFDWNHSTTNIARMVTAVKGSLPYDIHTSVPLLVCGGTSAVNGFQERLLFELKKYDLTQTDVSQIKNVAAPLLAPTSMHSLSHLQWQGAALASSSSAFSGLWITREELEEEGTSVLTRKIFQ